MNAGVWAAPGRVNLIGEHTDYSDGFVLPMALPRVCRVAAGLRSDGRLRIGSRQMPSEPIEVGASVEPGEVTGWGAYVAGVVWAFTQAGYPVPGADLMLDSDVPAGAGLSSSAAVGCSVALALRDLLGLPLGPLDLAALARRAENEFVGAPTGAMDQAVSMLAEEGHLLFLDTRDMSHRQVPFDLRGHGLDLLVIDTGTPHRLDDGGGYASRRAAVERGARELGVKVLRDVAADADLSRLDGVVGARVRHVVTENARVLDVVARLEDGGDPRRIGPLLSAGHASLRDDFEISTPELDLAVGTARAAGAHGARMTGGGFGGSAVALVDADRLDAVGSGVTAAFAAAGHHRPTLLRAAPSRGAHRLS